jgi:hypothetical protein
MGKVFAYGLTMAIPVAGMLASFLLGWCAWRVAQAFTQNVDYAGACFVLVTIAAATAFIFRVWKPLHPSIVRLGTKRNR